MNRLNELEKESINIIKKAYENIDNNNLGVLWSMGKDSTVLLHLIKKALGCIPFNVIHIDTGYKIEEMIKYRNKFLSEGNYDNMICHNEDYLKYKESNLLCCSELKIKPLNDIIYNTNEYTKYSVINGRYVNIKQLYPMKGLFVGIRGDEESTRSKEKFFSRRYKENWNMTQDDMELWGNFNYEYDDNSHIRIHPLLRWTELDVWEYIKRYQIEYIDLYHSKDGERYRTIGCERCTNKIQSDSKSVDDIINEIKHSLYKTKERSTRVQDSNDNNSLEKLRTKGYM